MLFPLKSNHTFGMLSSIPTCGSYRAHTQRMGKSGDLYIPSSLSIKRTNQAEKDATPLITSRGRNHIKMLRTAKAMQIIICIAIAVLSILMWFLTLLLINGVASFSALFVGLMLSKGGM